MPVPIEVDDLAGVSPADAARYLRATGWTESSDHGSAAVWTRRVSGNNVRVLLPASHELLDFPARMYELVSTLAVVEQRERENVLYDLRYPLIDVQYIRTTAPTPSGTTGLREGYQAIKGVHNLFLAAATSASLPEPVAVLPGTKPEAAMRFLRTVRLGPTGKGSYVLRVETPLSGAAKGGGEPARDVLLHLYRAVHSAHSAAAESARASNLIAFGDHLARGVSANLCSALADIGGPYNRPFDVSFSWAKIMPVAEPTPEIRFDSRQIDMLRSANSYLRDLATTQDATIRGAVTELKRRARGRVGGRVVLEGMLLVGSKRQHQQRVSVHLSFDHYELALEAHRNGRPLAVTGKLRPTGRSPEIVNVTRVVSESSSNE